MEAIIGRTRVDCHPSPSGRADHSTGWLIFGGGRIIFDFDAAGPAELKALSN